MPDTATRIKGVLVRDVICLSPLGMQTSAPNPVTVWNYPEALRDRTTKNPPSGGLPIIPPHQLDAAGVISLAAVAGRLHSRLNDRTCGPGRNSVDHRYRPTGASTAGPLHFWHIGTLAASDWLLGQFVVPA